MGKKPILDEYLDLPGEDDNSETVKTDFLSFSQQQLISLVRMMATGVDLQTAMNKIKPELLEDEGQAAESQYETLHIETNAVEEGINSRLEYLAHYTPLRVTYNERKYLKLLEATLEVSEYVDKVDIYHNDNSARKMAFEIKQICAILCGMVISHNYDEGQYLIKNRDFTVNEDFFQAVFEIGRRYKILNPERMRDTYGKLMYFLMDSQRSDVFNILNVECVKPVVTVSSFLSNKTNGMALLSDPLFNIAIQNISPDSPNVQKKIADKYDAKLILQKKYGIPEKLFFHEPSSEEEEVPETKNLTSDDIERVIVSIGDHMAFLYYNRDPCEEMLKFLTTYFSKDETEEEFNLGIKAGLAGSRLTHNHERQYLYVKQTLVLWRNIMSDMVALWTTCEYDLIHSKYTYKLRETGQGLQRIQPGNKTYKKMCEILQKTQSEVGGWIGSSAIHIGDATVPNVLMFIDKYLQVPRILGPLVLCLKRIPSIYKEPSIKTLIDMEFGSMTRLIKIILTDYFRHAFDGSGADNFFEAGSCIDGRLTNEPLCMRIFKFNNFDINESIVCDETPYSYVFIPKTPILPEHLLVSPIRVVKKINELTEDELKDLVTTVQKTIRRVNKAYGFSYSRIGIQDGQDAGQSVEHVHLHALGINDKHIKVILPRHVRNNIEMEEKAIEIRELCKDF